MGHDWGGALTWNFVAKYPEMVERAVIMNCPHMGAFFKTMSKSWAQFMKSWFVDKQLFAIDFVCS